MFLIGQMSGLAENFNIGIFSDSMNDLHDLDIISRHGGVSFN